MKVWIPCMNEDKFKSSKITFCIPHKEWTDLKIMCVLTHSTMSNFIRTAVREKIFDIKKNCPDKRIK